MKVDVIIMAGAKNTGALKECCSIDYEALIPIHGVPMVQYVARAARQARSVERIAVVGPAQMLRPHLQEMVDLLVEGQTGMIDNIRAGMEALHTERKVLILCSDIPMVRPEVIDDFVAQCEARNADFYYPIISKETNLTRFPGTRRTYARLKEGTYTGGNIFMMNPAIVEGATDFMRKMITWRKKPLKLSQAFGFKVIFKFALGNLSVSELECRVRKITGFSAAALVVTHPEVGFDVDKPSDLEMMEKFLQTAN